MEAIMQHEIPFIQKLVSNNLRVSSFFFYIPTKKYQKKKKKKEKENFPLWKILFQSRKFKMKYHVYLNSI